MSDGAGGEDFESLILEAAERRLSVFLTPVVVDGRTGFLMQLHDRDPFSIKIRDFVVEGGVVTPLGNVVRG